MPAPRIVARAHPTPARVRLAALGAVTALSVGSGLVLAPGVVAAAPGPSGSSGVAVPQALAEVPAKNATARGRGGAVSTVDPVATRVGMRVLRAGGNATDAAVATAAALGVTEPYSAGVGGGGYFVHYDATTRRVQTIDGRETAPSTMPRDAFVDPATGEPYPFTPDLVTSGVSVGVPGTVATWEDALERWGTRSIDDLLAPAERIARDGFVVDGTFRSQTADNRDRFEAIRSTRALYLPGGRLPRIGSVFRNPDLAEVYRLIRTRREGWFNRGLLADEIARTVQAPPVVAGTDLPVPAGAMRPFDVRRYEVVRRTPTRVAYRGLDVYGMAPSSSGGTTIGEALNIMEGSALSREDRPQALHTYLEASALAFADRGAYVGDPDLRFNDVPTQRLLSQDFADGRACLIDPDTALEKPLPAGPLDGGGCVAGTEAPAVDTEGPSTTHLSVVDRWGNAVAYTLTIEQTGGSGIVVPGRGFLLNNELTDFSAEYDPDDPNRIAPLKRPRSSMAPTIVLEDRRLRFVLGSPGGSTIITTVLQVLSNRVDLGLTLPNAVAAPRASQRNTATVTAEPAFIDRWEGALGAYGHELVPSGDAFTSAAEIGAVAAIEVRPDGVLVAAAEPERRGGGDARVVRPVG